MKKYPYVEPYKNKLYWRILESVIQGIISNPKLTEYKDIYQESDWIIHRAKEITMLALEEE